jgi:hypothetical protein
MHARWTGASTVGDLSESARELDALRTRVETAVAALPPLDTSGWSGPASWACGVALELLRREIAAAIDLLRCAADLTAAAAFEAGQSA